jgi:hypothetical protein
MHFLSLSAVLGVSFFTVSSVNAAGGFSGSCSNYYMQGNNVLVATCGNGSGGTKTSSIDLNRCIANYGGNLACAAK